MAIDLRNATFTGEDDGVLAVGANHDRGAERGTGLYLSIEEDYESTMATVGLSIDDIPAIITKLQAVYDDFEANKPKEPKQVNDITDVLPDGSVMHFEGERSQYVKIGGRWHNTYGGVYYDPTFSDGTWPLTRWTVVVDYKPEEKN